MGRTADRLPVFSSNGPHIQWSLPGMSFELLEEILDGEAFSAPARDALIDNCKNYLEWRRAELGAAKKSDAVDIWRGTKKDIGVRGTIERIIAIGEGAYPACYTETSSPFDAGQIIEEALFEGLEKVVIQLNEADLEPSSFVAAYFKENQQPAPGLHLNISRDFMMRLAHAFRDAVDHVENKLANLGEGLKPGQAFPSWLKQMSVWAEFYGYPFSPAGRGSASKYAKFLFALHHTLPKNLREPQMASATAMNDRLIRHRAEQIDPQNEK